MPTLIVTTVGCLFLLFTATVCELLGLRVNIPPCTCKCEVLVKRTNRPRLPTRKQQEGERCFSCVGFLLSLWKLPALGETVWIIMLAERPYITRDISLNEAFYCTERSSTESGWHVSGSCITKIFSYCVHLIFWMHHHWSHIQKWFFSWFCLTHCINKPHPEMAI